MIRPTLAALAIVSMGAILSAQQTTEADPLQCWWRSTAPAVRVGQSFAVVLTCSVVDTDTVKVVPDQAPFEPTVMQMPPFEVLGGTHQADLRTSDHRFFQYDYRLRIVSEDYFGKDIKLPETKVTYRVQTRSGDGPPIEGRDQTYFLPAMSIRVLSTVPADESDIRDASGSTFADVDARRFRGDLLRIAGGVLFVLAGLTVVLGLVRLVGLYRTEGPTAAHLVPDVAILRAVGRELTTLERERQAGGWTPPLVTRLSTALRIAASYALGRKASQTASVTGGPEGHLVVQHGWTDRKQVVVAGSATSELIRQELAKAGTSNGPASAQLQELERALNRLTLMQYGRGGALDSEALDAALATCELAVKRAAAAHTWIGRRMAWSR